MAAPVYKSGTGGNVSLGANTYNVQKWNTKEEAETASVMTTGSAGYEEVIPVKLKMTGSMTLFLNPLDPPTFNAGDYFTATFLANTVAWYSAITILITGIGATNPADKEVTIDVDFASSGAFNDA